MLSGVWVARFWQQWHNIFAAKAQKTKFWAVKTKRQVFFLSRGKQQTLGPPAEGWGGLKSQVS